MILGDFNCTLLDEERSSSSGASSSFKEWVEERGLFDLGFMGNCFTWKYGVRLEMRKAVHLDRAICCVDWRSVFPLAIVRHLNHSHRITI